MSCSRTQHGGGRLRTPDLSLRSRTLYHWATTLPAFVWMRPSQWGGWGLGGYRSLGPLKRIAFFPMFPKNKILIFYVLCSPKLALFPCSPHFWTFVPLFPWKICPRSPVPQNPLKCLIKSLHSWKCILRGEVGHFSSASKWKDGFTFSFNVEW